MCKKVISIVLCIIMVLSFSACSVKFWKNSGTSDTEKLDKYEKGFFTKDAYYNESCGLKFNCTKEDDYKIDSVKNVTDFSTPLSEAEAEIEAICKINP